MSSDQRFNELAGRMGCSLGGAIKIGSNCVSLVVGGGVAYVSGQASCQERQRRTGFDGFRQDVMENTDNWHGGARGSDVVPA